MDPTVMHTEDGYLVTFDEPEGPIVFEFADIYEKSHDISCDLTVTRQYPVLDSLSERMNILSATAKSNLRGSLNAMWEEGKGYWVQKVNQACAAMRAAHSQRDWSVDLSEVDTEYITSYLWHPLIPEQGHTIWFGKGEGGKTLMALAALLSVAYGWDGLGYEGPASPVLFVDYESGEQIIKRRLERFAQGLGIELTPAFYGEMFHYWPGQGKAITSMMPAIKRKVDSGVRLMVIDSAALAAGGSPQDEQTALAFFNAIRRLGVPCVTLAHVTKQDEDQHPFGSIFWHNSARATWNVKGAEEMQETFDGLVKDVGMYQRKGNEDKKHGPVGFKITFGDTSTSVRRGAVSGELAEFLGLGQRIRRVLLRGKATIKEIQLEVGGKHDTIYRQLKKMPDVLFEGKRGSNDTHYFIVASDPSDGVRSDPMVASENANFIYPIRSDAAMPQNMEQWWTR